jgi:hypothetical protein
VNTSVRHKALLATLVAICTVSCSSGTPGSPSAVDDPSSAARPTLPGTGGSTTAGPTSNSNGVNSPTKGVDPCGLLAPADTASLGVAEGTRQDSSSGTSRRCVWTATGSFTMDVTIFDTRGIKDVAASGQIQQLPKVGRHEAVKSFGGVDSCAISMAITETSRVDTSAAARGDAQRSCDVAMQVARLIEPKLPGGS